jgi:hypothetical protein
VLRLLDAHTRSYAKVRPARPGLLLVCAQVPGVTEAADLTGPRVLLLADLLARAAEMDNLQVFYVLASDGQPAGQQPALERAIEALGIQPPAARASSAEAQAALGGPIDVYLASHGGTADDRLSGLVVPVGAARSHRAAGTAADLLAADEPLAVRLALLSLPYHQPADLTEEMLIEARATVGHWRLRVAQWAESPSRPVPAQIAETVQAAFGDLNTVSALALLRGLEADPDVPAGAKFETFLYADRILGLGLPRDIGRALPADLSGLYIQSVQVVPASRTTFASSRGASRNRLAALPPGFPLAGGPGGGS